MKLLVNGARVQMEYLPLETQMAKHTLHIKIADVGMLEIHSILHGGLVGALDVSQKSGRIMDRGAIENGFSEIHIAGGTMLEAIDMMRRAGFGMKEVTT